MTQDGSIFLRNGLTVDVIATSDNSRLVYFSKSVRGVEFTKEESESFGNLLLDVSNGARPMKIIRLLLDQGFFNEQKDLQSVRNALEAHGVLVRSSPLNTLLGKMVARKELRRDGKRRLYRYKIISRKPNVTVELRSFK